MTEQPEEESLKSRRDLTSIQEIAPVEPQAVAPRKINSALKMARKKKSRKNPPKRKANKAIHKGNVFAELDANEGKRVRKKKWQTRMIKKIFLSHEGKMTSKLRRNAEQMTGLRWQKIYKHIFDLGYRHKFAPGHGNWNNAPRLSFYNKQIFKITKVAKQTNN